MKSNRHVMLVAVLLSVTLPGISAEPLRHVFTGRVCRGKAITFQPGDVPCEQPLRDVAVTVRNSRGTAVKTVTDADGRYSIEPIALYGTDDDFVIFEARRFLSLKIGPLTFAPDTSREGGAGLTVFLQRRQKQKKVYID
jgi:hypothetical protein